MCNVSGGRRRTGSTGSRCVVLHWRFWTRHGLSVEETSPLVFPNRVGKQLEEKQLRRMRQTHKIAVAPHGFCSSFRDWAAEETDHPREVIEAALAHVVQNKVEAAYRRTDLFERRRVLMEHWAAYLSGRRLDKLNRVGSFTLGWRSCRPEIRRSALVTMMKQQTKLCTTHKRLGSTSTAIN